MALITTSMTPFVFGVSPKCVNGRIAFAVPATTNPTGLTSRGHSSLPPQSRMSRERYETAMPNASWPADRRPGQRGCHQTTRLARQTKPAQG
jgi:hypothetical protein